MGYWVGETKFVPVKDDLTTLNKTEFSSLNDGTNEMKEFTSKFKIALLSLTAFKMQLN